MEASKVIQGLNSAALGLFSLYLMGKGDVDPLVIAVPAVSAGKYLLMSLTPDISPKTTQWAHYLAWFLTTPIMLWLIFSLNNVPFITFVLMILLNQLMIAAGYLASIAESEKDVWNWFAIGCFAFLPIVYELLTLTKGFALVALTLVTWSLYPIVWWLSRKEWISLPLRNTAYSFLDFTSKAGLVTLYLMEIGKI